MAPASRFTTTLPSGARNATTGAPASCSGCGRMRRSRSPNAGGIGDGSGSIAPAIAARRIRAPPASSAQSAQGSPVISPSWSGCASTVFSGSGRSEWKAFSGWIQNRSPSDTAGTTRAPPPSARARSSPARARTGAPSDRTANRAWLRDSARSPGLSARPPATIAIALAVCTATCRAAVCAYRPSICSHLLAEPIAARATDPSGITTKSAVSCVPGGGARGGGEGPGPGGCDMRGS